MNKIITLVFFFLSFSAFSQTIKEAVKSLKKVLVYEDAIDLMKTTNWEITSGEIAETDYFKMAHEDGMRLATAKIGETIVYSPCIHCRFYAAKILSQRIDTLYSMRYLVITGDSIAPTKIDSMCKNIIDSYKSGILFDDLFDQFNMDGSGNRITQFRPGQMLPEIVLAINQYNAGDIFRVDILENKWHFIILKTAEISTVNVSFYVEIKQGNAE